MLVHKVYDGVRPVSAKPMDWDKSLKFVRQWRSWHLHIITSGYWTISFLELSQLPGEYTVYVAKYHVCSAPRTISALTGTHLPLGEEKQL